MHTHIDMHTHTHSHTHTRKPDTGNLLTAWLIGGLLGSWLGLKQVWLLAVVMSFSVFVDRISCVPLFFMDAVHPVFAGNKVYFQFHCHLRRHVPSSRVELGVFGPSPAR